MNGNAVAGPSGSTLTATCSPSGRAIEDSFFKPLDQGATTIRKFLQEDSLWPDLTDHLAASPQAYKLQLVAPWSVLSKRRIVNLPDALVEASASAHVHAEQGLFPEIQRAWIVIDNTLHLWNYLEGSKSSIETYDHPESAIRSVALVKPRAGVFIASVQHVLVIATDSSISLLCLAFDTSKAQGSSPEIALYVPEMKADTGGVLLSDVSGTSSGRIFCRGSDQCLYELVYQAQDGWFKNKCYLNNLTSTWIDRMPALLQGKQKESIDFLLVDDRRNVIYTLHNRREISVYHLLTKDSSQAPKFVARAKDICRLANFQCPNTGMLNANDFQITWLGTTTEKESKGVHLVAMTSNGVRLYFSHIRRGYGYGSWSTTTNSIPNGLDLIYTRPSPPKGQMQTAEGGMVGYQLQTQTSDFPPQHPGISQALHGFYGDGIFIAASPYPGDPQGQTDNIFCVQRSMQRAVASSIGVGAGAGQHREELTDTASDLLVPGVTWAIAEAKNPQLETMIDVERISPLATQVLRPPRVFLILSSGGLVILVEQRPIDSLRTLLEIGTAFDQPVGDFFRKYGLSQACAMTLAIASRNSQLTTSAESVLHTVLAPGADSLAKEEGMFATRYLSPEVVNAAFRIYFDWGGAPRYEAPPFPSQSASEGKVVFSARHDALAMYTARLMRVFWNAKIARKTPVVGDPNRLDSNLDAQVLAKAQQDLQELHGFIQRHAQLLGIGAKASSATVTLPDEKRAEQAEQESLTALSKVIARTLEALSFALLLIDYKMPTIITGCKPELQTQLLSLTYADLITTSAGREAARGVVEAVIDVLIASQVSIDAVADVLQERCGSFCNADDVRLYKALEGLRRAREALDQNERIESLRESLRLLLRAAAQLPFDKLKAACTDFAAMQFAQGAIQLPLRCAALWDSKNLAISYYAAQQQGSDEARKAYHLRSHCYSLVLESLAKFDDALNEAVNQREKNAATDRAYEETDALRTGAYALAEESEDPLFHAALYDSLLQRRMTEQLLAMRTPYIRDYLAGEPLTLEKCELLWQYHVRVGEYFAAATVLAGLAQTDELDLSLFQRIEYLSLASSNARSAGGGDHVAEQTEIEDMLEVAQVQGELYKAIEQLDDLEDDRQNELLAQLDSTLLDISSLYRDFVQPLQLYDIMIMIFHVSDYQDAELVKETWEALLDQAHESAPGPRRFEHVAATVISLAGRYFPSETACPVDVLTDLLERYAFSERDRQKIPIGWAAQTLSEAGADQEGILDVLDLSFHNKKDPWTSRAGLSFLLADTAALIELWLEQTLDMPSAAGMTSFPAKRIDDAINAYIVSIHSLACANAKDSGDILPGRQFSLSESKLKECQERIRRSF
ncbi:nucleoporin-domain-containing protein [Tilletiaria anomala UBC 951]|uniref:Nucleoporin-domain-containing protein n=1 Tax=Tilletiaria anomala (strain ATCC 24038 / CBS 436.72 / UBC 951) TaxID=1037660 RepID=A0A066W9I4_TILAU|nr:nucleoporin-domain-containing protein [Tilletiaria anomala UBC 951]KDN50361.1 nucleoporin-domain-containing protein [Tilletiaria anomala UBC 951]